MLPAVLLLGLGFAALDRIGPFSRLPSVSSICHLPSAAKWKCQDRSEFESPAVFAGVAGRCVCFLDRVLFLFHQREDAESNSLDGRKAWTIFLVFSGAKGVVRFDTGMDRVRCA